MTWSTSLETFQIYHIKTDIVPLPLIFLVIYCKEKRTKSRIFLWKGLIFFSSHYVFNLVTADRFITVIKWPIHSLQVCQRDFLIKGCVTDVNFFFHYYSPCFLSCPVIINFIEKKVITLLLLLSIHLCHMTWVLSTC